MANPSRVRPKVTIKSLRGFLTRWRSAQNAPAAGPINVTRHGWFDVVNIPLGLSRLAADFDGYRLAQISDIHMDGYMNRMKLIEVVAAANAAQPDLVLITGDFVTHDPEQYSDDLIGSLSQLHASDGVLAVLGNHDHWSGPEIVRTILQRSNIRELRNQIVTVCRGQSELHVTGIDSHMAQAGRLDQVIQQLPERGAALLLAHEPDFADTTAATRRFDLQLSGHSHGGQVSFPIIGPPFLPFYAHKYPRGLYRVQDLWLYTNRGLGIVHVPWRYNSRPEVAIIDIFRSGGERN